MKALKIFPLVLNIPFAIYFRCAELLSKVSFENDEFWE